MSRICTCNEIKFVMIDIIPVMYVIIKTTDSRNEKCIYLNCL